MNKTTSFLLWVQKMEHLSRIIRNVDTKEHLTSSEIKTILSESITSQKIVYLVIGMDKYPKLVIPDLVLSQGVARLNTKSNLLPMSLALRYQANPNLYINVPKLGNVHILVYLLSTLVNADRALVYNAVYVLLVSGSNPTLPPYNTKSINAEDPVESSVLEWVESRRLEFPLEKLFELVRTNKKPESRVDEINLNSIRMNSAILLDRYNLLKAKDMINEFEPIRYHANDIFNHLAENKSLRRKNEDLRLSIEHLNLPTFITLTRSGVIPVYNTWEIGKAGFTNGYNTINTILLTMEKYKNDPVISNTLLRMLVEVLKNGAVFDNEQLAMLRRINSKAAEQAIKAYSEPFWSKECKLKTAPSSPRFSNLAANLSLDVTMPKQVTCKQLSIISEADKESLIAAAITRQRSRMAAETSMITDYVDDTPTATCVNATDINPEEYADLDVVFYKDGRNMTWCFTRADYDTLLSTKANPVTMEKLPSSLLNTIRYKKQQLSDIGIADLDAMTITESIKLLMSEDTISSKESSDLLNEVLAAIGISRKKFDTISNKRLEDMSVTTGNRVSLTGLTQKHAQYTFARAVAPVVLRDKAYANLLLSRMAS